MSRDVQIICVGKKEKKKEEGGRKIERGEKNMLRCS